MADVDLRWRGHHETFPLISLHRCRQERGGEVKRRAEGKKRRSLKGEMRGISAVFFERSLDSVRDTAAGLKPEKATVKVVVHCGPV